jgi:hypothetical protein
MLPIVVARYRNGHSQARICMKTPAEESLKTPVPSSGPNMVKTPTHRIPMYRLYRRDMEMVREIRDWSPSAWASATVGSKSTAMELVMAEGKRIKGIAIPVSTP